MTLQQVERRNAEVKCYYEVGVRNRKSRGKLKLGFRFTLIDRLSDKPVLRFATQTWYPVVDYLTTDERYVQKRDYEIVKKELTTRSERVSMADLLFYNPECARRATVFLLAILGVEKNSYWISKMIRIVKKLGLNAIDFWFNTAIDRFLISKTDFERRISLIRLGKAIRVLYEKVGV